MRRLLMAACFFLSAVAVVVLAGCGGDTGPTGDTSPNTRQAEKEKPQRR
jgi:hypothetical protein